MRLRAVVCLLALLVGCVTEEVPVPVPPAPADLSTWSAPVVWTPPPRPEVAKPKPERPAAPNEQLYTYEVSKEYEVPVPLGVPADVMLEPGEVIQNIVGGDRTPVPEGEGPRWEVKEGLSDTQYGSTPHVFLSATQPGLTLGLIVTTSRRVYYLTAKSVAKSKVRAVRWRYAHQPVPVTPREPVLWPDPAVPQRYHVGYRIEAPTPKPEWVPVVLDDGRKTYLLFSPVVLATEMPLVRMVGPQGPQVLNSRQVGPVLIIDRLVPRLELRYGAGEHAPVIRITRGALHTITCPGAEECPVWPAERGESS